jgi:hypothetical protein
MSCIGRCGIYENRPTSCKTYPQITDTLPSACTYYFLGDRRMGSCQPEVCQEQNCCSYPRENGEPEAKHLDFFLGGEPCKHLVWEYPEPEKVASDEPKSITPAIYEIMFNALRGTDV